MDPAPHFPLLGEPLSLDLVNTRIRRNGADIDLLGTSAALHARLRAEPKHLSWAGPVNRTDWLAARALHAATAELSHALAVLPGPHAERSRKRANPDCVSQFVAGNPHRRWCSSAPFGNRARVMRHYRLDCKAECCVGLSA